jgi:hypothetical protein
VLTSLYYRNVYTWRLVPKAVETLKTDRVKLEK